jgi:hypothetical protein
MRKSILAATTAFVLLGGSAGMVAALAQPVPPPANEVAPPPMPPGRGPMAWHRPGPPHPGPNGLFALVYPAPDRNLSPADVQKIAEAFLLWRGNHTWKVVDVAPTSDGQIGFAIATQDGSVIAKFTMNPHTGRMARVG